jgi:hypothetical protein
VRVAKVKEQIAIAALKLLESPEQNMSHLRLLLELGLDESREA